MDAIIYTTNTGSAERYDELLAQEALKHGLILQLDELITLKTGEPEEIFIERKKPRVAHGADHTVVAVGSLHIVGFENPGDFLTPVSDQVPRQ